MRARTIGFLAAALSALAVVSIRYDLVPVLRGPAPYPPEWQWRHRPRALARALPAVPFALGVVGVLAWSGSAAARRRPRTAAAAVVAAGLLLGTGFSLALVSSEDGGAVAYLTRRTASPGYLSYHAVACSPEVSDLGLFLREYPTRLPRLPMHAATHPPLPVVAFATLIRALEDRPALVGAIDARIAEACGRDIEGCGPHLAALPPAPRAAALAGALLSHLTAMLTILPVAGLAFQLTRDPLSAARVAALWPLVPGAALFVPALDPALAFPVTLALLALRWAVCAERTWRRFAAMLLAGAAGTVALYLSYGSALFLLLGTVAVVASLPRYILADNRPRVWRALAGTAVAGIALSLMPLLVGHDFVGSMRVALALHAGEYTARRSYPLWLVFGPLDVALFLGVPVVLGLLSHARRAFDTGLTLSLSPPARLALGTAAALVVLFLSGTVRGEVGRLLVPLMPLGLLAGMLRLEGDPGPDARTTALTAGLLAASDVVMRLNWRI